MAGLAACVLYLYHSTTIRGGQRGGGGGSRWQLPQFYRPPALSTFIKAWAQGYLRVKATVGSGVSLGWAGGALSLGIRDYQHPATDLRHISTNRGGQRGGWWWVSLLTSGIDDDWNYQLFQWAAERIGVLSTYAGGLRGGWWRVSLFNSRTGQLPAGAGGWWALLLKTAIFDRRIDRAV